MVVNVLSFTPDQSSFDAYGLKIAANDRLFVESLSTQYTFLLRLAPFNYSLTCTIGFNNSNQYIYSVAVARKMSKNSTIRFIFIGINTETDIPFVGSLNYTGVNADTYVAQIDPRKRTRFPCDGWNTNNYNVHRLENFKYDETDVNSNIDFFVVAVEPMGQFAYAFTKSFIVLYNLDTNTISVQLGNVTWPDNSFLPYAVDISEYLYVVVLGFIKQSNNVYTPCAYLLRRTGLNLTVFDTWKYTPLTNTSWQASLTNSDADTYSPRYTMSVSINDIQHKVILGIQIMNTIVMLNVNVTTTTFILPGQRLSNGRGIGMGKAVGWLGVNITAVLVNTYSLGYVWSASQIFIYNLTGNHTFFVRSVIPNLQQTFAVGFGPILLSIVTTQNGSMIILDSAGNYYILLPSPAGTFADSSTGLVSSFAPCIGGTFSTGYDIYPCKLCPEGFTTGGRIGQSSCIPCDVSAFCPLGAAYGNIGSSSLLLASENRAPPYPVSPQSTRFDNILMNNIFIIRTDASQNCLVISPFFWALIVMLFGAVIALAVLILEHGVQSPFGKKIKKILKGFFRKADLVGEGELWIGGIVSFAIVILAISAYIFSSLYFRRYPIEDMKDNVTFACDGTLLNSQFKSGLMSLVVSPNDDEIPIYEFLNQQQFTLNIDLINTFYTCEDVTSFQIKDTNVPLPISSCINNSGFLSFSTRLPSHGINLQYILGGTNTIGGIRLTLQGTGTQRQDDALNTQYTLQNLEFIEAFTIAGRLLTQHASITIQLTKIINRTYPLTEDGQTRISARWAPFIAIDKQQIFVDDNEYKYETGSNKIISLSISEMPFYVFHTQKPIVDQAELVFTNLLFTIVCIEIFGFLFVVSKLMILPLIANMCRRISNHCGRKTFSKSKNKNEHGELTTRF